MGPYIVSVSQTVKNQSGELSLNIAIGEGPDDGLEIFVSVENAEQIPAVDLLVANVDWSDIARLRSILSEGIDSVVRTDTGIMNISFDKQKGSVTFHLGLREEVIFSGEELQKILLFLSLTAGI